MGGGVLVFNEEGKKTFKIGSPISTCSQTSLSNQFGTAYMVNDSDSGIGLGVLIFSLVLKDHFHADFCYLLM